MLKDASYKEKCLILKDWMPQIMETVKKDLKSEHLKKDFKFAKKYFAGKNINKLTTHDFVNGYISALEQEENAEEIAEFITQRWLLKNTEVYDHFEKVLSQISTDFTQLSEIESKKSLEIIEESTGLFGALRTYLFSVMNSVVFPKEIYEKLHQNTKVDQKKIELEEASHQKQIAYESLKQHYEEQLNRVTDKYEKKLLGIERKYFHDIEGLKKQISSLQKKLNGSLV